MGKEINSNLYLFPFFKTDSMSRHVAGRNKLQPPGQQIFATKHYMGGKSNPIKYGNIQVGDFHSAVLMKYTEFIIFDHRFTKCLHSWPATAKVSKSWIMYLTRSWVKTTLRRAKKSSWVLLWMLFIKTWLHKHRAEASFSKPRVGRLPRLSPHTNGSSDVRIICEQNKYLFRHNTSLHPPCLHAVRTYNTGFCVYYALNGVNICFTVQRLTLRSFK